MILFNNTWNNVLLKIIVECHKIFRFSCEISTRDFNKFFSSPCLDILCDSWIFKLCCGKDC